MNAPQLRCSPSWAVALTTASLVLCLHAADKKVDVSKLPAPASKPGLTYEKDIKPILEQSCFKCHSGDKAKGKYHIDAVATAIKGGDSKEAAIKPGKSAESPMVHYAADLVPEMEMPPVDKRDKYPALTRDQIALVRAWIDQGAR